MPKPPAYFISKTERNAYGEAGTAGDGAQSGPEYSWILPIIVSTVGAGISLLIYIAGVRRERLELAAYVTVSYPELSWNRNTDTMAARFQIENSGRTPAYDVVVFSEMSVMDDAVEDTESGTLIGVLPFPPYEETRITKTILGPGRQRQKDQLRRMSADETDAYYDHGGKAIYVYGEIQYRDIFKRPRWTTFCFLSNKRIRSRRQNLMAAYREWNQADEESKPPFCKEPAGPAHYGL